VLLSAMKPKRENRKCQRNANGARPPISTETAKLSRTRIAVGGVIVVASLAVAPIAQAVVLTVPDKAPVAPVLDREHAAATQDVRPTQAAAIARWLGKVAVGWVKGYAKTVAKDEGKKALSAAEEWVSSGGTQCNHPFPQKFCSSRTEPSAPGPMWGLGLALSQPGEVPAVWNRVTSPRFHDAYGLAPGGVYWLTCWAHGDWVSGPGGFSNLWYRLTQGGFASDVWLYTGTDHAIPGVQHCRR
jgi:hypothetical protein